MVRKGGKLNWDKWGKGYKIKEGEKVYSIESTDFFFTSKESKKVSPKNYQRSFYGHTFRKVTRHVHITSSENSKMIS